MNELKDVIVFLYQRVSGFSFNVELSTRHIFLYLIEKMKYKNKKMIKYIFFLFDLFLYCVRLFSDTCENLHELIWA